MISGDKWMIHTVAIPSLTRTIDCYSRNKEGKVVRMVFEEMVHMHDVYRRKAKGPEGKILWHRGAKVGVVA